MSAKKIARTAGCGTWDGQNKPKPFKNYEGDKIVGSMKLLNYVVNPECESEAVGNGYWYLHEYSLSEDSLKDIKVSSTDYVICRVIRDDSKSSPVNVSKAGNGKKRKITEANHARMPQVVQEDQSMINHQYGHDTTEPTTAMDSQYSTTKSTYITTGSGIQHEEPYVLQSYITTESCMQDCVTMESSIPEQELDTQIWCNPTISTEPFEEICRADQKVIGTHPTATVIDGVETFCGNQEACPTVEDNVPAISDDDFMNLQQYISPEFVKMLQDDDDHVPGGLMMNCPPSDDWFAEAGDFWSSSL